MAEQDYPIAPTLQISNDMMKNHMITFLLQYIAAVQHITDKRQLVCELFDTWQKKFMQSIETVKQSTSRFYAEKAEEDEDVWRVLLDANNYHIESISKEFSEKIKEMLIKNLNLT